MDHSFFAGTEGRKWLELNHAPDHGRRSSVIKSPHHVKIANRSSLDALAGIVDRLSSKANVDDRVGKESPLPRLSSSSTTTVASNSTSEAASNKNKQDRESASSTVPNLIAITPPPPANNNNVIGEMFTNSSIFSSSPSSMVQQFSDGCSEMNYLGFLHHL
jgi:hypothetical protein